MSVFRTAAWSVVLMVVLSGCSRDTEMGQVSGTVTFKGKPVTAGVVLFQPERGPMAAGGLNAAGRFTVATRTPDDGVTAGLCRVCVTPVYPSAGEGSVDPAVIDPANIPKRYRLAATSPLTAEVTSGQVNEVAFDLQD